MEELSSRIFSAEEAKKVESEICERLLKSPRLKTFEERWKFALHLTSKEQKDNFGLLITGFCRKFVTLARECYSANIPKERKAAFSVAWMKILANFQLGKKAQERIILERRLLSNNVYSHEDVHSVLSTIHELVYTIIRENVRSQKEQSTSEGTATSSKLSEESDDTLYRYCGAALQRMIKLRQQTLAAKKKQIKLSSQRRPVMEKDLQILEGLVIKGKSAISQSLKHLDKGNLTFPRVELISFLRSVHGQRG